MKLSEQLKNFPGTIVLAQDGDFDVLEQCTRIRAARALTYVEREKFLPFLENKDISCVICTPALREQIPAHITGIVISDNPKLLFFQVHNDLAQKRDQVPSVIDPTAEISPLSYIAPNNVIIGAHVQIEPFVWVGENTVIEDDVRICVGSIIASQGFTSVRDGDAMYLVRDAGKTVLRRGVVVCGQCDVAQGTLQLDVTELGRYSMLDAKVHIGHGTVLKDRVTIPSGAHIAGNCIIGEDVWIGVNATVSNRIEIGDHARVSLGSVVTRDVPAGETVTGNFAIPHQRFLQNLKESVKEKE